MRHRTENDYGLRAHGLKQAASCEQKWLLNELLPEMKRNFARVRLGRKKVEQKHNESNFFEKGNLQAVQTPFN